MHYFYYNLIMQLFFSPSSVGYLFGAVVSLAAAWELYRSYRRSRFEATKNISISLVCLGIGLFIYGIPPFFLADKSDILGWASIPANLFLGIWLAYLVKFVIMYNFSQKNANTLFYLFLFWAVFIVAPINIAYPPSPSFDQYGLLILHNKLPIILSIGLMIFVVTILLGSTMLYGSFTGTEKRTIFPIATAFIIGGIGSVFITSANTTSIAATGYLLVTVAFVIFLFVFME